MGFLDNLESMAAGSGDEAGGSTTGRVAGGLLTSLEQHPGGLGGLLQNFRNNGLGGHVDAMQNGDTPSMTPDQAATGLNGTGLLEQAAQRAGVSPEVAKVALAAVLPIIMTHFAQNGEAPSGGMLGGMLSRIL